MRTPGSGAQTRLVLGGLAAEKQMTHEDSPPRARWRCRACRPWGASTAQHCVTCPLWICRGRGRQDDSWALAPTLSEPGVECRWPEHPNPSRSGSSQALGHAAWGHQAFLRSLSYSERLPEVKRGHFPQSIHGQLSALPLGPSSREPLIAI